jgi:hypothetical protein
MPSRRRVGRRRRTTTGGRSRRKKVRHHRRVKGAKGVRVTKGRVSIRVAGHGVTKLAAAQLVRYVPLSKLKTAAKKVLTSLGRVGHRRRRKGRRKGRKKRRRRRRI